MANNDNPFALGSLTNYGTSALPSYNFARNPFPSSMPETPMIPRTDFSRSEFDPVSYMATNTDVRDDPGYYGYGDPSVKAWEHWNMHGKREGRLGGFTPTVPDPDYVAPPATRVFFQPSGNFQNYGTGAAQNFFRTRYGALPSPGVVSKLSPAPSPPPPARRAAPVYEDDTLTAE